jgi:hypothetical protein
VQCIKNVTYIIDPSRDYKSFSYGNINIDVKVKWLNITFGLQLTETKCSTGERMRKNKREPRACANLYDLSFLQVGLGHAA